MPYKVEGKKVLHEVNGRWTVKQTCESHEKALAAVRLLHMKGYGSKGK
ncbi:MAG: hypothetical protein WC491_08595 [Candidatus Omnitrophota bacterium]